MVDEACKEKTAMLENDVTLTTTHKVLNIICDGTILYYNLLLSLCMYPIQSGQDRP